MIKKEHFKGITFFCKGLKAAKSDMWASMQVLVLATVVLAIVLYFVEHVAQPDVYKYPWDPLLWGFMSYLGNPGDFSPGEPITIVGRFIAIIISVIKILIFAVPAGLVANGFRAAMEEDKREKKLNKFRKRMHKAFRRNANKTLREYLNSLPDKGGEKFKQLNFVPQNRSVALFQVRQAMNLQDIIDTVVKFPEFRLKTLAATKDEEEGAVDRFVVELAPINRPYGCCINRNSRVTIVSTSGFDEVGTSWFTYYVAKLGGFNYISKEVEIDSDELDSYFNMSPEPVYEKKNRSEYEVNKEANKMPIEIIDQKQKNRKAFLNDLQTLTTSVDSPWVIVMGEHTKNSSNTVDFHFCNNNKDGNASTIDDVETYERLYEAFTDVMQKEMQLYAVKTTRYYLHKNNLLYRLKDNVPQLNGFVFRPSSHLISLDSRRLLVAFRMAQIIADVLVPCSTILDKEKNDFAPGFGYAEQAVEEQEIYVMDK